MARHIAKCVWDPPFSPRARRPIAPDAWPPLLNCANILMVLALGGSAAAGRCKLRAWEKTLIVLLLLLLI